MTNCYFPRCLPIGLKLSYRNNLDQPEFECLDDCVKVMTESQIAEFGCITDTCEKRRRRSYGYTCDTITDAGPSSRTAINFGNVSRCMASKFYDGNPSHHLSANYSIDDDCDGTGTGGDEGMTASYPVNGCGIKREVPSSSSSSSGSNSSNTLHFDKNSISGNHQSQQHGSQRSVRLQNNPSQPLFSRSKTDTSNSSLGSSSTESDLSNQNANASGHGNIHGNGNGSVTSMVQSPKKAFCPIQSRIVDLINLCKNNILGSGTGTGTGTGPPSGSGGVKSIIGTGTGIGIGSNIRVSAPHTAPNTYTHSHNGSGSGSGGGSANYNNNNSNSNGGELLQISDEEMLTFPKLFTDAFNIGDYEGVSTVRVRPDLAHCLLNKS